jgi:predicted metal-dependent phosphotriesterase family hydrolase
MSHVRTVLGDVDGTDLGRVNYHEHLFQVSPLLPGDELTDEPASTAEAALLVGSGITAMVDATPTGLGRRPEALGRISAGTGLQIVATTGAHRDAHYGDGHWLTELSAAELGRRFVADIEEGMSMSDDPRGSAPALTASGQPVRAGVLKGGIDYWSISPFERRVLEAVGAAHAVTGAPVMVHLEHGSAAFEVLQALRDLGVSAEAVVLAHIDRNPDPGLHAELAATGAYLGYDGVARSKSWPDSVVLECLLRAAELGAAERILLGGDVARRTRYVAYGGMPGLAYLADRFLPRLAAAGSPELVDQVMVANPLRWLLHG